MRGWTQAKEFFPKKNTKGKPKTHKGIIRTLKKGEDVKDQFPHPMRTSGNKVMKTTVPTAGQNQVNKPRQ